MDLILERKKSPALLLHNSGRRRSWLLVGTSTNKFKEVQTFNVKKTRRKQFAKLTLFISFPKIL